jgi:hypothetical protein
MNKMKNKILLGCALSAMLLTTATSCSDYLTEDAKGQLTPTTFFTNLTELKMAENALYDQVCGTQCYTNMQIPQWQGDDMTANPGSNKQAYAELDRFSPSDANKGIRDCWNRHYNLIKACNYVIANAAKTPTTEDEINIAIGQAKYWRAYSYFTLVRVFGPLPMVLTTDIDYNTQLSSVEDVYAQIVSDLTDCIKILPTDYTTAPNKLYGVNIYATKQAAEATRCAVYMAMAGYPLNKGAEYYKMAAADAKSVIDNESTYGFKLESDYKNVYAPSHNYSMETIIGIPFTKTGGWGNEGSQLTSCDQFESVGGWGDCWGEIRFWKNMPEGPRKDATYAPKILYGNTNTPKEGTKNGQLVNWYDLNADGSKVINEYHPMFCVFSVGSTQTTWSYGPDYSDYDYTKPVSGGMINGACHRLIRYSELLLWYAEAQARGDGTPNSLAYTCINRVRNRAGLPNLAAGLSGSAFADACVAEHGWEVAGYWVAMVTRRADQFRMNTLKNTFQERLTNAPVVVATVNGKDITATESVTVTASSWTDDMNYAPYPAADVALNPNLKR